MPLARRSLCITQADCDDFHTDSLQDLIRSQSPCFLRRLGTIVACEQNHAHKGRSLAQNDDVGAHLAVWRASGLVPERSSANETSESPSLSSLHEEANLCHGALKPTDRQAQLAVVALVK
jgi:hypothetical protein